MGYIDHPDRFVSRHIGPDFSETSEMLSVVGASTLDEFVKKVVPESIRISKPLSDPIPLGEREAIAKLRAISAKNRVLRSHLGLGYHNVVLPPVIQRNILENPGWYTQYTPYQAEISQGRLEALLNFQTMITDLTGLEIANASLLDEATAAAEAMTMCFALKEDPQDAVFFVSELCHPQTIELVKTRAWALGIKVLVGDHRKFDFSQKTFGALLQYPATEGTVFDYEAFILALHEKGGLAVIAADIFALAVLRSPGEFGADIAVGSTQRFGMPMGFGGPHAAYFATRDTFKRHMPGRIIGVSKDSAGNPALRLSLQTREQHIRREKATSNICTAQVLPAIVASMYAVYHGPKQLRIIAERMHDMARLLAAGAKRLFHKVDSERFFDTLRITLKGTTAPDMVARAAEAGINLRAYDETSIIIALDETSGLQEIAELLLVLNDCNPLPFTVSDLIQDTQKIDSSLPWRKSPYLQHPVFNRYHSETEMLRYIKHLESKDLSLTFSMIPLGSCTMKLNATAEMMPITWPDFANIHPFAPDDQSEGYHQVFSELEGWLRNVTGFVAVSLQPNSGAQGEYTGLLVIRRYYEEKGESRRNICLIPSSAHGTNPASATMAGFKVVIVKCDALGNIDVEDMRAKAVEHRDNLAACMITYPSTHGVFETEVKNLCQIVHENGGQVYMDGANMNAQVGLCKPAEIGADVCHLNLHKTFCIPHGGGGPGAGPIAVSEHLAPYLPGHPVVKIGNEKSIGPVAAAPWGSALVMVIPWMYIAMAGGEGLTASTIYSILNANYIAKRLSDYYPILYKSPEGYVAHECILDCRSFKAFGIEVEDIAKRLMDYGFHSPTMSWPVPGTLMVEPTESESRDELDRFCDAMISIYHEIKQVENGQVDAKNNLLKNSPHTVYSIAADKWDRPYSREQAVFPNAYTKIRKFWPSVGRIDNVYGDRNLFCTCPPISQE